MVVLRLPLPEQVVLLLVVLVVFLPLQQTPHPVKVLLERLPFQQQLMLLTVVVPGLVPLTLP